MEQMKASMEACLSALIQVLERKEQILKNLLRQTREQEYLLKEEKLDMNAFEDTMQRKEEDILTLEKLDEGFDRIYQSIKEGLQQEKKAYQTQIDRLQKLILSVTDLGVQIEALERHNKEALEGKIRTSREQIKTFKVNNRAAANYYKHMANGLNGDSYFLDQKK